MKFKGKEIKVLYVKFKHKETKKQRGTDRNRQNREEQTGIDGIIYLSDI
jgi:hypothetical protein